ncbi:MAG: hypothetical protein M3150_03455 [Pseudomonadota bacterium]|nr:hypothetical protein [Pseudomonadota bacterium]
MQKSVTHFGAVVVRDLLDHGVYGGNGATFGAISDESGDPETRFVPKLGCLRPRDMRYTAAEHDAFATVTRDFIGPSDLCRDPE